MEKFDGTPHLIKLIIIRCGQLLDPEEKNVSKLYEETTARIGIPPIPTDSSMQMKRGAPDIQVPVKKCPQCKEETFVLTSLCRTCKDAEGGTYKSAWICRNQKCGHKERSERTVISWLEEMGYDISGMMSKEKVGVKTLTDEGLKAPWEK